jgi:hypothetical protein
MLKTVMLIATGCVSPSLEGYRYKKWRTLLLGEDNFKAYPVHERTVEVRFLAQDLLIRLLKVN